MCLIATVWVFVGTKVSDSDYFMRGDLLIQWGHAYIWYRPGGQDVSLGQLPPHPVVATCLPVCEQHYVNSSQAFFVQPCRIIDYCHGKYRLNFRVDPSQRGQMAAIFNFCYIILNSVHFNHIVWV